MRLTRGAGTVRNPLILHDRSAVGHAPDAGSVVDYFIPKAIDDGEPTDRRGRLAGSPPLALGGSR